MRIRILVQALGIGEISEKRIEPVEPSVLGVVPSGAKVHLTPLRSIELF